MSRCLDYNLGQAKLNANLKKIMMLVSIVFKLIIFDEI